MVPNAPYCLHVSAQFKANDKHQSWILLKTVFKDFYQWDKNKFYHCLLLTGLWMAVTKVITEMESKAKSNLKTKLSFISWYQQYGQNNKNKLLRTLWSQLCSCCNDRCHLHSSSIKQCRNIPQTLYILGVGHVRL